MVSCITDRKQLQLDLCCQLLGAIFTLFVPRFRTPAWRPFRAAMFVFMASSGFYPIIYATYAHGLRRTVVEGGALYHMLAALFYSSGAVIYAVSRAPCVSLEREWTLLFFREGSVLCALRSKS